MWWLECKVLIIDEGIPHLILLYTSCSMDHSIDDNPHIFDSIRLYHMKLTQDQTPFWRNLYRRLALFPILLAHLIDHNIGWFSPIAPNTIGREIHQVCFPITSMGHRIQRKSHQVNHCILAEWRRYTCPNRCYQWLTSVIQGLLNMLKEIRMNNIMPQSQALLAKQQRPIPVSYLLHLETVCLYCTLRLANQANNERLDRINGQAMIYPALDLAWFTEQKWLLLSVPVGLIIQLKVRVCIILCKHTWYKGQNKCHHCQVDERQVWFHVT